MKKLYTFLETNERVYVQYYKYAIFIDSENYEVQIKRCNIFYQTYGFWKDRMLDSSELSSIYDLRLV